MMYTVNNTTATSANLPNLQCDTKYTIWVYASGGQSGRTSVSRMASVPARGMCNHVMLPVPTGPCSCKEMLKFGMSKIL